MKTSRKSTGSRHSGEADALLGCQERNLVKLKFCNSDLVDPKCGREIMDAFHKTGSAKVK